MAVRLDRQGCAIGLLTNGITQGISPVVPISRSPQQLSDILEALARLKMEPEEALINMLHKVEIPWGTSCLYFTLEDDPTADVVRAHFKRRKTPVISFTFEISSALRRDKPADVDDSVLSESVPAVEARGG